MNTLQNKQNTRRNPKPQSSLYNLKPTSKPIPSLSITAPVSKHPSAPRLSYNRESMLSLDREFLDDPLKVGQYCKSIFKHILDQEVR